MLRLLVIFILFPLFSNSQCIYINEIMIDGSSCDGSCNPNTAEWVELYNGCGYDVDVSCYVICDGDWTYSIPTGTVISDDGYLTIGGASNEGSSPDLTWDLANYTGTGGIGTFTNSAEQLALFEDDGTWIDGILWGGGQGLPDNSNPVTVSGSCSLTNVNLPSSGDSRWENIGGDGSDGSTMSRECDGYSTWVNTESTSMTFGENNGCIPMTLLQDSSIINIDTESDTSTNLIILKVYDVLGREINNLINGKSVNLMNYNGIVIIRYTDGTTRKVQLIY